MRLFRCLNYRLAKKDTAGILFERAREIAFEITNGQTPISFYLEESSLGQVSVVQRVLKKFPELKKFEYMVAENLEQNRPSYKVLSNRSAIWDKPNPNGCTKQVTNHILQKNYKWYSEILSV